MMLNQCDTMYIFYSLLFLYIFYSEILSLQYCGNDQCIETYVFVVCFLLGLHRSNRMDMH